MHKNHNKIVGIQFSIASPDEIIRGSVAEITSRETYNGKLPAVGGLFDIRMGVIDSGLICPTDGLTYMQTPGYFGHIVMAKPMFFVQFIPTLMKVLKCICFKCSRLLLSKRKYRHILSLSAIERWKFVNTRIATLAPKRCGDDTDIGCGCEQPKIRKDGLSDIYAEWKRKEPKMKKEKDKAKEKPKGKEKEKKAGAGKGKENPKKKSKKTDSHTDSGDDSSSSLDEEEEDVGHSSVDEDDVDGETNKVISAAVDTATGGVGGGVEGDVRIKLTAERVLKICKKITDEDISFLGLSPIWSRPEWMICQVMTVPPPAVRPSVKYDAQQRSEDDISHSLMNILKFNKLLKDKITVNAPPHVIEAWTSVLQYYMATLVDNKIPGSSGIVAARSGRALKSIKERLNGKHGRMRGNLMAKRVDFSARSVITADPNISIRQLGIPVKIAKNITKPVVVNSRNIAYLTGLVRAGPDVYPGAKILEKKNGMPISLKYANKMNIHLAMGDIVHRHMIDGDPILFNRQPSLHRMSMMCHLAKIMHVGSTFRMNVADTKPYNADFDGDEMNLHMPQDVESEVELKNLAAVPFQIISPADNKPIISVFQDSILGCFLFTEETTTFSAREAMNLLMKFPHVDTAKLFQESRANVSNYAILSQILPPMSYQLKTDTTMVNIKNGTYTCGRLERDAVGKGTNGIIHRICNDFGNIRCSTFIDDLQNIVTLYLKKKSFSVGISDLVSNSSTQENIAEILRTKKLEVKNITDEIRLGIFENNTGKPNEDEFESTINNTLNRALSSAEKECFQSLSQDNRFITMVNAGSKGQKLNISQMVSCLGQQNVDNKRIPYGYDSRTLPHFHKYDDSPGARGFVENSYISGLNPQEMFFHAMAGRVGIIDTAVKTAVTGYIQRRLIKGLEDIMVSYDMTLRNNKGKIIQFRYGDDGIDPMKIESQPFPLIEMNIQQIFDHFLFTEKNTELSFRNILAKRAFEKFSTSETMEGEFFVKTRTYVENMLQSRNRIVENVFQYTANNLIHIPVAFRQIIRTVRDQFNIRSDSLVDMTPLETLYMIESSYARLVKIRSCPPTPLFEAVFFFHLSPKQLIFIHRFHRVALTVLLERIVLAYKQAIVNPGEMVGLIAAQSIGGPITQMTLNTFHYAGIASKSNVTRGVPRIDEILSVTDNTKNPSHTIFLKPEYETDREKVESVISLLEYTRLDDIVSSIDIHFDPSPSQSIIAEDNAMIQKFSNFEKMIIHCGATREETAISQKSKWIIRILLNPEKMLEKGITVDDIHFAIQDVYRGQISAIFADFNADQLVFRIRVHQLKMDASLKKKSKIGISSGMHPSDQADEIFLLKNFQDQLLQNIVLKGVKNINKVVLRTIKDNVKENDEQGAFQRNDIWVLDTIGSNLLDVLGLEFIDKTRTMTNDISETERVLGIEATRQLIYNELIDVLEFDKSYINSHHIGLLCDRMCHSHKTIPQSRHGIIPDDIGPVAKGSFETTPEVFLKAAIHAEVDFMRGVSANTMCGQEGLYGTNSFQVMLNADHHGSLHKKRKETDEEKEDAFKKKKAPVEDNIIFSSPSMKPIIHVPASATTTTSTTTSTSRHLKKRPKFTSDLDF